jgi:hypothetical protein
LEPRLGDKIVLINGAGKKTHNYTFVAKIIDRIEEIWLVEDKYRVPLKIKWQDNLWVQVP